MPGGRLPLRLSAVVISFLFISLIFLPFSFSSVSPGEGQAVYTFIFRAVPENVASALYYNPWLENHSAVYTARFGSTAVPSIPGLSVVVNAFLNYTLNGTYHLRTANLTLDYGNNYTSWLNVSLPQNATPRYLSYFTRIYNQTYFLVFAVNTGFTATSGILFLNGSHRYTVEVPLRYEPFVWSGLLSIADAGVTNATVLSNDAVLAWFYAGLPNIYYYAGNSTQLYAWARDYGARYLTGIAPAGSTVSGWPYQGNTSVPQENGHWLTLFVSPSIRGVNYTFVEHDFRVLVLAYPGARVSTYTLFVFSGDIASRYDTDLYTDFGMVNYASPYYGNGSDILFKSVSPTPEFSVSVPEGSGNITLEAVVNYTDGNSLFQYMPLYVYARPAVTVVQLNGTDYDYLSIREFSPPSVADPGFGLRYNNTQNLTVVLPNGTQVTFQNITKVLTLSNLTNLSLGISSLPNPVTLPDRSVPPDFPYPLGSVLCDGVPVYSDRAYGLYNFYEPYRLPNWMMFQASVLRGMFGMQSAEPNGVGWSLLRVPVAHNITLVDIFGRPYDLRPVQLDASNSSVSRIFGHGGGYHIYLRGGIPVVKIVFDSAVYGPSETATGAVEISGLISGLNYSRTAVLYYYAGGLPRTEVLSLVYVNGTLVGRFSVPASSGAVYVVYNSTVPFIGIVKGSAVIPAGQFIFDLFRVLPYFVFGALLLLIAYILVWVKKKLYNRGEIINRKRE
ncbi:MAG: hypothetical protein ACP5G5_06815 [Thermoplasmata archaeon]